MTAEEYQDAKRFPITTQPELSLKDQLFIDAVNWDGLNEAIEDGLEWTPNQQALRTELEAKIPHQAELRAVIVAARPAPKRPEGWLSPEEHKANAEYNRMLMGLLKE